MAVPKSHPHPSFHHVARQADAGRGNERPERRAFERRGNIIALQGRESRLRFAARAAGFGIYDFDCSSGEVRWSSELKTIAGVGHDFAPAEPERLADFAHPDDRARLLEKIRSSQDPLGSGEFEDDFRLLRPQGSTRWVRVKGWTFFAGDADERHLLGAIGVVIDLARMQAADRSRDAGSVVPWSPAGSEPEAGDAVRLMHELRVHQVELEMQNEELRQTRQEAMVALQRYTQLYDLAPVGYFSLDGDGVIRQLNLAAAGLLGNARSQLVGKRFGVFVQESDRPVFNALMARVLEGEGRPGLAKANCEIGLVDPEKPQLRRIAQMEATFDETRHGVNAVAIDVTDKRQATDDLVRSNIELQQFAYVAAHDLQTPLRSISGFVQMLQHEYQDHLGAQADAWIGQAVRHVHRMQALIQDLLTYSRLDSPRRPQEPTDFNRLFDEVVESLGANIRDNGAAVTRDELPTVVGSRVQLAQVLQNLIDNGIKYRGGEAPRVHVSARREAGSWVFSVHDNGIGIAGKHHQRIFEVFSRLHSQQDYPGTGIGLAICQRVIQRHGGRIWLESEAGGGSVFFFTLPEHQPERG